MHWKAKVYLQKALAALPRRLADPLYYQLQRHVGNLHRAVDTLSHLGAGLGTWTLAEAAGCALSDAVFCEIGTGRMVNLPVAYWLMGARQIITVDLNRLLRPDMMRESLATMQAKRNEIISLFGSRLDHRRFDRLMAFPSGRRAFNLPDFLEMCQIVYHAPRSGTETGLPAHSVDVHCSFAVFEHLPPATLVGILQEGARILRPNGVSVHAIDYSDHRGHSDPRLHAIDFLQFSDATWLKYGGNRFSYTNRLRHDDVVALCAQAGHRVIATETFRNDPRVGPQLRAGIRLDPRFASKPPEVLDITNAWIVAAP
jgi:hypothetical protein